MAKDNDDQFTFDVRRTMILSQYMKFWGMPEFRTCSYKKEEGISKVIEVYEFPPQENQDIYRFATIGTSVLKTEKGRIANWEFLLCVPDDFGGASRNQIKNFLLDIVAYSLQKAVTVDEGFIIPPTDLAPKEWTTRAFLFDEARGEPEELAFFEIGKQKVNLIWVTPITEEERIFIKENSLEEFDKIVEESDYSILDVNRESMVCSCKSS